MSALSILFPDRRQDKIGQWAGLIRIASPNECLRRLPFAKHGAYDTRCLCSDADAPVERDPIGEMVAVVMQIAAFA